MYLGRYGGVKVIYVFSDVPQPMVQLHERWDVTRCCVLGVVDGGWGD